MIETNSKDFNLLRKFVRKIVNHAKNDKVDKKEIIKILENCLNDKTCPLSWENVILIRNN